MPQASQTELTAILESAAIAPIERGFLRITGSDATRWLNGMVTNNIKDLAPGEGNYNFLLNAQGRIQGDCTIYREPGEGDPKFLLETDIWQLETVHQTLDKFIIMDDVELERLSLDDKSLAIIGARAHAVLTSLGFPVPQPLHLANPLSHGIRVVRPNFSSVEVFEIFGESGAIAELMTTLLPSVPGISPATLEAFRILSGTPKYGTDIRNTDTAKDLPQETAQDHALNFNKGCYLGQEIVERIHSQGRVHKQFQRLELSGELPTLPCPLTLDGKPAGELTSAALIPLASGPTLRALGYVRREAATATLTYPGGTATVLTS